MSPLPRKPWNQRILEIKHLFGKIPIKKCTFEGHFCERKLRGSSILGNGFEDSYMNFAN